MIGAPGEAMHEDDREAVLAAIVNLERARRSRDTFVGQAGFIAAVLLRGTVRQREGEDDTGSGTCQRVAFSSPDL